MRESQNNHRSARKHLAIECFSLLDALSATEFAAWFGWALVAVYSRRSLLREKCVV
jgi:hypothetical protein